MSADPSSVLVEGPWEHRFVAANGARFHVASLGDGPLVVFLHGFPQFWWAFRHQLEAVGAAGYRAVAMDLRGYGASDKPPIGYEAATLAADVAGVVRCLGETDAVVVGHGIGGWLAWSLPLLQPDTARAVAILGTPHPASLGPGAWRAAAFSRGAFMAVSRGARTAVGLARPFHPEREMTHGPAYVHRVLRSWTAAGAPQEWPSVQDAGRYAEAMAIPFAAHSAAEAYRWLVRAPLHPGGRAYLRSLRRPVDVPVLVVRGDADPVVPDEVLARSADWVRGPLTRADLPGAGHAPHEQCPEALNDALLAWLPTLP